MEIKCYSVCGLITISALFAANTSLHAQGIFIGGQPLDIIFSAISSPPGTNQPSGGASFFQVGWNPDTSSPVPNQLIVSINLGMNPATDGWILQMESDGSLSPILEFTNEFGGPVLIPGSPAGTSSGIEGTFPGNNPPAGSYIYSQSWQLTSDQMQNLLAGEWYAEVDYGSDEYISNLTPVPEPETLALIGVGIFASLIRRRK
jgi:hypothetical protein